jgi:hypothetical protein
LIKNNNEYKIISHVDDLNNRWAKKFNLRINDYSGVFYMVTGNEALTIFIVKHGKIISFCSHMRKGEDASYIPWLINKPFPE